MAINKSKLTPLWLILMLSSCTGGGEGPLGNNGTPNTSPIVGGSWYQPAISATWQWQLLVDGSHPLNTSYIVDLYDIDLFETTAQTITDLHTAGRKVICYFSAGSYEDWRSDAGQFPAAVLGNTLDEWPGEKWLDIRADSVKTLMQIRLDLAQSKGCDGVEPDNMDGYQNVSGFPLTTQDQLDYNAFIANEAHTRGLSVGLKNDLDQINALVDYFDFSVNEQCHEFGECSLLRPFVDASKPVFNAEYATGYISDSSALCSDALANELRTLVLPLDLDDSFRISCD